MNEPLDTHPTTTPTPNRFPALQVLGNKQYRNLWTANWAWQFGRWMWMIMSAYVVLQLTDSTFQTSLVGAVFFGPMLLGGVISGVIADGFNRRNILLVGHTVNLGLAILAAVLTLAGAIEPWHILVMTLAFGSMHTLDQVTRRGLVSDLVDREHLSHALALETMVQMGSVMVGPLVGGALIEFLPLGKGEGLATPYLAVVVLYVSAVLLLLRVRAPKQGGAVHITSGNAIQAAAEGFKIAAHNPAIIGTLSITLMANMFFFTYVPLIPVFAEKVLDVGPTLMGLLGGAHGAGAFIAAAFIALRGRIDKKSGYYYKGTLIALGGLFIFSLSQVYSLSFAALVIAGTGIAGFATMQPVLIILSTDDATRGRLLGIVTMTIGVLPLAMVMVGGMAELFGPAKAVGISAGVGVALTAILSFYAREMRKL
ncbi:MAG TPA: MFS transporter [Gemmatimonadetes bacterium]|nr:MFS transporter [Gemmatimonadota bacterium]